MNLLICSILNNNSNNNNNNSNNNNNNNLSSHNDLFGVLSIKLMDNVDKKEKGKEHELL